MDEQTPVGSDGDCMWHDADTVAVTKADDAQNNVNFQIFL